MSASYFVRKPAGEGPPPKGWIKGAELWVFVTPSQAEAIAAFREAVETEEAVELSFSA